MSTLTLADLELSVEELLPKSAVVKGVVGYGGSSCSGCDCDCDCDDCDSCISCD